MNLNDYHDQIFATDKNSLEKLWKKLNQLKADFLMNNADPRKSPFLHSEIAESWIRSKGFGVNPYSETLGYKLQGKELSELIKENKLLIDIAIPLITTFKQLLQISGYMLSLHSSNGTILYQEGDQTAISNFNKINSAIGSVWKEDTVGTTAHSLSIFLKKPVQLLGPENYSIKLENNLSSSAPILDDCGNVIGALVIVQILDQYPYGNTLNLKSHTLGWVSSLGVAIEKELKLSQQNKALRMINKTMDSTLAFIDEGIISIDYEGKIKHLNREALHILQLTPENAFGKDIKLFFENKPEVLRALTSGEPIDFLEVNIINESKRQYLLCVKPILDEDGTRIGAVLRLAHSAKINDLVNKRGGASAKFKFENIIGNSELMKKAKSLGKKYAIVPENILIIGESGTGKELFAQAIHNEYRAHGPFIAINCAAVPRNLIESELFGYEGGTFTGAERQGRPGKIELANGGTLFLDEIGDMPFEIQAALLRVLEDKQVMRLGGKQYKEIDFRVVAATNQDLLKLVSQKLFRLDLYYRLSVLNINLPPLRQREGDILLLSQYFIDSYCQKRKQTAPKLSYSAQKRIVEYDWPGNVRQLENAIIYAVNTAQDTTIELNHLPDQILNNSGQEQIQEQINEISKPDTSEVSKILSMTDAEIAAIKNAIQRSGRDLSMAADILGIGKATLYRKIKKYNLTYLTK